MTLEEAERTLRAHGATHKGKRDGIDWYWAHGGYWIAKQPDGKGGVVLTQVPAGTAGCGC